ncbi:Hint domain-containing protein [Polyangium sp. y55x31]|uniref:Hint domain-containing protein n=1 Tax=Polyangium sp. y55x31 TaxID=3042688 RepID=UPI0024824EEC|nr:Hint domain-containing protein [Polyangium sp. y55x31]MDI1479249.1 Hint domain-containing protein [Polyangium sp. y55x31]
MIKGIGFSLCMMGASCYLSQCFVRGTRIVTPHGFRSIEELAVGDEVYSFDVETRQVVVRKVGKLIRARAPEILHIALGELCIAGVTSEHPFYDAERGAWIPAREVREGMRLVAWLGAGDVRELEVTVCRRAAAAGEVEVFNLSIDGPEHNYFAEGVLVHNKDEPGGPGDPLGQSCLSNADCIGGENLVCAPDFDGVCGPPLGKKCARATCGVGPLSTICGCDGKPHAVDNCTSETEIEVDKREGACAPPAGRYNCGDGTCASDAQYCLEGYSEIKCVDVPPSCLGSASCDCLEAAGVAACGCVISNGGLRIQECEP